MFDIGKFGIQLPCPHCGEAKVHLIRKLVDNPHVICPVCDRLIDLEKWRPALRKIIKSLFREPLPLLTGLHSVEGETKCNAKRLKKLSRRLFCHASLALPLAFTMFVGRAAGGLSLTVRTLSQFEEAIRNKLIAEISGLKLSRLPPLRFHRVQYYGDRRYNCFIGEELQEHPKRD